MAALVGLLSAGCGRHEAGHPPVYYVLGKVLVNGQPAERAEVSFHPLSETAPRLPGGAAIVPFAMVDADGSFRPSTYTQHDGAPAGEYAVTVIWPKVVLKLGEEVVGPDQLNGKYSNRSNPVQTVIVKEGENQLPAFELKRP